MIISIKVSDALTARELTAIDKESIIGFGPLQTGGPSQEQVIKYYGSCFAFRPQTPSDSANFMRFFQKLLDYCSKNTSAVKAAIKLSDDEVKHLSDVAKGDNTGDWDGWLTRESLAKALVRKLMIPLIQQHNKKSPSAEIDGIIYSEKAGRGSDIRQRIYFAASGEEITPEKATVDDIFAASDSLISSGDAGVMDLDEFGPKLGDLAAITVETMERKYESFDLQTIWSQKVASALAACESMDMGDAEAPEPALPSNR